MLSKNFYVSGNDGVELHDGEPLWSIDTSDKSKWWNNGKYWNVNKVVRGNSTTLYIQYGFNAKPFASCKFLIFNVIEKNIIEKNRTYNFSIKYEILYFASRETDTEGTGDIVEFSINIDNKKYYNKTYNTRETFSNNITRKITTNELNINLKPQSIINNEYLLNLHFDYKNVFPSSDIFLGLGYANNYLATYYPGKFRNGVKFDDKIIKQRNKVINKDLYENEKKINIGRFRYRINNQWKQINALKE